MVTRVLTAGLFLVVLSIGSPAAAETTAEPALRHQPVSETDPGAPLTIEVKSPLPDAMIYLRVYYRTIGGRAFEEVDFARLPSGDFVADIPASDVKAPGVEYYLAARTGPLSGNRFASPTAPHQVRVARPSAEQRMEAALELHEGRRSRFSAGGVYVNYGPVSAASEDSAVRRATEQYYALDVDFTYRFLTTLHALRFGVVRLRGHTITGSEPLAPATQVGYDYGFAEVSVAIDEAFGMVGELQLGANQEHFTFGGGAGIRIGRDPGTHLVIWGGGTVLVGASAGLRLHWDTVPGVPMAASMEVTSWPDMRLGGLRLVYQAEFPLGDGLSALPEISYQARSARFGRLGGGLRIAYAF